MAFLGKAAGEQPEALLNYGAGIALVIVALAFFMRQDDPASRLGKKSEGNPEEEARGAT